MNITKIEKTSEFPIVLARNLLNEVSFFMLHTHTLQIVIEFPKYVGATYLCSRAYIKAGRDTATITSMTNM